jgi:hypothetical protein
MKETNSLTCLDYTTKYEGMLNQMAADTNQLYFDLQSRLKGKNFVTFLHKIVHVLSHWIF